MWKIPNQTKRKCLQILELNIVMKCDDAGIIILLFIYSFTMKERTLGIIAELQIYNVATVYILLLYNAIFTMPTYMDYVPSFLN